MSNFNGGCAANSSNCEMAVADMVPCNGVGAELEEASGSKEIVVELHRTSMMDSWAAKKAAGGSWAAKKPTDGGDAGPWV
ncbi:hypothetical protein Acr_20g0010920 [Actinidia rufa]|uniref:Uncharacterized protein n=1 Tax=Actinidia rufa TaxID=165716 RepID=A0A7J0GER6_9ERIC|nr:hypothetical protein Acr_20g0010920 [Actinidia rufa]